MRVVADTNVLISATFWNGDSHTIIEMVERKELTLLLSKSILEEFSEVLNSEEIQEKIIDKNLVLKRSVERIMSLSEIVEPSKHFSIIQNDPDDDTFLDCAIEGNAEFIITQDHHLLNLKEFKGIKIVTPSDFLHSLV